MSDAETPRPLAERAVVMMWIAVIAAIGYLTWPMWRSGDLLGRDMVFTPYQSVNLAALGLGSGSPRAVPLNSLTAVGTNVLGSWVTARLAILLVIVVAMTGVRRVLRELSPMAQVAAMMFAAVNPYVVERLALGQWAVLSAYAALPWLLVVLRRPLGRDWLAAVALVAAFASITPTGGLCALVAVGAFVVQSRFSWSQRLRAVAAVSALQAPWIIASLASGSAVVADPAGVGVFSARAERGGPVVLSLLTGGGIWNAQVAVPSQAGILGWLTLGLVVVVVCAGVARLREVIGGPHVRWLGGLALAGVLIAAAPTVGPLAALLRTATESVPGVGLLRDSQKFIAAYVIVLALLTGCAVDRLSKYVGGAGRWFACIAAIAAPIAVLPDAMRVLAPTLTPVHYSAEWATVHDAVDPTDVTYVVPASLYRNFDWMGGRSAYDPAERMLDGVVVLDDALVVGQGGDESIVVRGESTLARDAAVAAASADPATALADLGISMVLIEHQTPGASIEIDGEVVHDGPELTLIRIDDSSGTPYDGGAAAAVILAHGVSALLVSWAVWSGRRTFLKKVRRITRNPTRR